MRPSASIRRVPFYRGHFPTFRCVATSDCLKVLYGNAERSEPRKHVILDFSFVDFVEKFMPSAFVFFYDKIFRTVFAVDRAEFFNRFAVAADGIGAAVDY